ncbi:MULTISPECIES: hypothetical protein [unclassified Streptomyces]|uniref:hypothetical protein n=1 Tax=unclassified Streptomyces TaxID=2593676 RepID=UPI003631619F
MSWFDPPLDELRAPGLGVRFGPAGTGLDTVGAYDAAFVTDTCGPHWKAAPPNRPRTGA